MSLMIFRIETQLSSKLPHQEIGNIPYLDFLCELIGHMDVYSAKFPDRIKFEYNFHWIQP